MSISHWISATRPKTLAAGIAPVLVGSYLGSSEDVDLLTMCACLLGALCIQIGCNFANDAIDALKGADNEQRIGPRRAVASGDISARHMLLASIGILIVAFAIGIYLSLIGGWIIFALGVISIVCAYAYTGGPFPLAYIGLGDVFVFLFFGLFAVLGSAYLQQVPNVNDGMFQMPRAWLYVAAAVGLQATAIIAVNNLRDRIGDKAAQKITLAVRLGAQNTRIYIALLHLSACLCLGLAAVHMHVNGLFVSACIAGLGGIALSIAIARRDGPALNRFLGLSAALELVTGLSIVITLAN